MREAMTATAPSGALATLPSRAASRGAAWRLSRDPYGVPRRGSDVLNVLSHELSAEQRHRASNWLASVFKNARGGESVL